MKDKLCVYCLDCIAVGKANHCQKHGIKIPDIMTCGCDQARPFGKKKGVNNG